MSVECSAIVWKRNFGKGGRKLIAARLADHADDEGRGIFPSLHRVAAECNVDVKTVRRTIHQFVEEGILVVVKQGGHGPKTPTRYDFNMALVRQLPRVRWPGDGLDAVEDKRDNLTPLAEDKGDILSSKGGTVSLKGGTAPPKPSITINNRQMREGARAENPGLEKTETDAPVKQRLSGRDRGDLIDRGVADWPKGTGRTERGIAELKKLSDADLTKAVHRIPAWLALWKANGRDHVPALSTYAGERLFNDVEDKPPQPPSTTTLAKPGGKLWHARFFQILFGPMADLPEAATDYLRIQLTEEGPAGDRARRRHQARYGWPEAAEMIRAAEAGRGWSVALALERVAERCQSVAVDSDLFRAWRAEHERRGWPFLDRRDAHVWLPAAIGNTAGMSPADIVEAALAALQAGLAAIENEEISDDDRTA